MTPLRIISLIELLKGAAALVVSLVLYGGFLQEFLAPAYVHLKELNPHTLFFLTGLVLLFVVLRFAEAYGLWFRKPWGLTLGLLSSSIYLPFEFYELHQNATAIKAIVIGVNLCVLAYFLRKRATVH